MKLVAEAQRRRLLKAGLCMAWLGVATGKARAGSFDDFFAAAKRNNLSALLTPLLRGFDVNTQDEKGQHALHVALRADSLEVALFLANLAGVNVNATTPQGETPLMIAALRGDRKSVV